MTDPILHYSVALFHITTEKNEGIRAAGVMGLLELLYVYSSFQMLAAKNSTRVPTGPDSKQSRIRILQSSMCMALDRLASSCTAEHGAGKKSNTDLCCSPVLVSHVRDIYEGNIISRFST